MAILLMRFLDGLSDRFLEEFGAWREDDGGWERGPLGFASWGGVGKGKRVEKGRSGLSRSSLVGFGKSSEV